MATRREDPGGPEDLPPLTERQQEIYLWLAGNSVVLRLCPQAFQVERHFGINRASADRHVRRLVRLGYLRRTPCGRLYIPVARPLRQEES